MTRNNIIIYVMEDHHMVVRNIKSSYPDIRICGCEVMGTWGYEDMQIWQYENFKIWAYMRIWSLEDMRSWGYEDMSIYMRIWRYEGMTRYKDSTYSVAATCHELSVERLFQQQLLLISPLYTDKSRLPSFAFLCISMCIFIFIWIWMKNIEKKTKQLKEIQKKDKN